MYTKKKYNTKALSLVHDCLRECGGAHMTADEITALLTSRGEKIGKTTVYRNLEKLVNSGLVHRYTGGDSACFSIADDSCHEHFHLRCQECGKLIHIECSHMDELSHHIADEHGFKVDRFKTVLYGLCGECSR